ncbi:hypothetical protein [Dyadobacter tibetensis]|uniref:hypothetical protein n=1 Tax=Dyadobacter tibetensis TaxID=1211851 RepID=UPI00046F793D|nr:hypothetical protein [Dyadobacter tibetensis]
MSTSTDLTSKISAKPFSSDTEAQKQELEMEVGLFKDRLDQQLEGLKEEASEVGKKALIVGGIVVGTYLVMNALLPKEKEEKSESENNKDEVYFVETEEIPVSKSKKRVKKGTQDVLKAAQGIAWTLAVGWARKQLLNYIAADPSANEKNEQ